MKIIEAQIEIMMDTCKYGKSCDRQCMCVCVCLYEEGEGGDDGGRRLVLDGGRWGAETLEGKRLQI